MSDGLIVPRRIEYIITRPPRKRWPLAALLSLLIVTAVVGGVLLMRHFSRPHKYPTQQLPLVGLKAGLRTKWVNGSGHYIFLVRPTPGNEARFISVLQNVPQDQMGFVIHLLDSDGFEVCNDVPAMHTLKGPDGKASGLKADQTFTSCNKEQMRSASQWHVTYRFPLLNANIGSAPAH